MHNFVDHAERSSIRTRNMVAGRNVPPAVLKVHRMRVSVRTAVRKKHITTLHHNRPARRGNRKRRREVTGRPNFFGAPGWSELCFSSPFPSSSVACISSLLGRIEKLRLSRKWEVLIRRQKYKSDRLLQSLYVLAALAANFLSSRADAPLQFRNANSSETLCNRAELQTRLLQWSREHSAG